MLAGSGLDAERQQLLFDLGCFHRREAKPAWWAIFDSLGRDTDELIDDLDCLGGLEAIGPARRERRSIVRDYRFPEQETRLKAGSQPTDAARRPLPLRSTLAALDRERADRHGQDRRRQGHRPARPAVAASAERRSTRAASPRRCAAAIADQCGPRAASRPRRPARAPGAAARRRAGRRHPRRRRPGRGHGARRPRDAGHGAADPGSARHRQDLRRRPRDPRAGRGRAAGGGRLDQPRGDRATCCAPASPRCPTTRPG